MLRFKKGFRKYIEIPSSWEDLTYSQVMLIMNCTDDSKLISIVTGLDEVNSQKVFPFLGFLFNPIDFESLEAATIFDGKLIPDIRTKSYGQKLMFQNELKKGIVKESICKLIAIYHMEDFHVNKIESEAEKLHQRSFIELFTVALNLINQLKAINETELKMLKFSPTPEQQRAGIKDFEVLGDFNTIDELAHGKPWMYETIERTEYNIIFAKLLKINISSKFDKKYRELMTEKK